MMQFLKRLHSSIQLNLTAEGYGRDLQSTFDLLSNIVRLLVALSFAWAVAAGFLQTGRLVQYIPKGFPGLGDGFWAQQANWLGPLLGVPAYALKAFAVTMLLGLAAAMVGGLLGFLFGVPRPAATIASTSPPPVGEPLPTSTQISDQATGRTPGALTSTSGAPGITPSRGGRTWQSSTNLTEISDWLTKIIVGVGLVEAKAIFENFTQLSQSLGAMLFDGAVGSQLVIPSVIIAGALIGFLYAYLFTQLVIAGLLARTDSQLSSAGISMAYQAIVPRAIQSRKEEFSDYIQGLVAADDATTLDHIAEVLKLSAEEDFQAKRGAILTAVGAKVNVADPVAAAKAMDDVSSMLQTITRRTF